MIILAYLLEDRPVAAVNEAVSKFIITFKRAVHTVARGTKFSSFDIFETQYSIRAYYCHTYSPAERGSNERFNRILRYFYPRGTHFKHLSGQELRTTLLEINQRPFKVLSWQTPYQVMLTNLPKNSD